jgi:hypothetical protein
MLIQNPDELYVLFTKKKKGTINFSENVCKDGTDKSNR